MKKTRETEIGYLKLFRPFQKFVVMKKNGFVPAESGPERIPESVTNRSADWQEQSKEVKIRSNQNRKIVLKNSKAQKVC